MKTEHIFIENCCLIYLKFNSALQYRQRNWWDASSWASSAIKIFENNTLQLLASTGSSLTKFLTSWCCGIVFLFHIIIRRPGWFIACCERKHSYCRTSGRVWKNTKFSSKADEVTRSLKILVKQLRTAD